MHTRLPLQYAPSKLGCFPKKLIDEILSNLIKPKPNLTFLSDLKNFMFKCIVFLTLFLKVIIFFMSNLINLLSQQCNNHFDCIVNVRFITIYLI